MTTQRFSVDLVLETPFKTNNKSPEKCYIRYGKKIDFPTKC